MAKLNGVDWKFGSAHPIKPNCKKSKEIAQNILTLDGNLETEITAMFMKHEKENEERQGQAI